MSLLTAFLSNASGARSGGVTLASALLTAPAVLVAHAGPGALVAGALFVAAAVLLDGWRRAGRAREMPRLALVPVPVPSRSPAASARPRARWELVERDGRQSLSMRWS